MNSTDIAAALRAVAEQLEAIAVALEHPVRRNGDGRVAISSRVQPYDDSDSDLPA